MGLHFPPRMVSDEGGGSVKHVEEWFQSEKGAKGKEEGKRTERMGRGQGRAA